MVLHQNHTCDKNRRRAPGVLISSSVCFWTWLSLNVILVWWDPKKINDSFEFDFLDYFTIGTQSPFQLNNSLEEQTNFLIGLWREFFFLHKLTVNNRVKWTQKHDSFRNPNSMSFFYVTISDTLQPASLTSSISDIRCCTRYEDAFKRKRVAYDVKPKWENSSRRSPSEGDEIQMRAIDDSACKYTSILII